MIKILMVVDVISQQQYHINQTLKNQTCVCPYVSTLCEHIEKEPPWNVMLITRSTRVTPNFVWIFRGNSSEVFDMHSDTLWNSM